ncbi:MAG: FAD:protein FMN transferase [Terriglobia bacterium]|nr:MAG: FAD:protein FMN transferase [Terriglobia bacterium]
MGTFCEIQGYDSDAARAGQAIEAALDEMSRIDRLLSNYDPASELSAMNRSAASAPFRASAELFGFVAACRRFYDESAGTFDPTVGALVRAWGFFARRPELPSAAAVAAAKAASGFDNVRLIPGDHSISYLASGLEFDPGGIGKGYAVDRAVAVLRRLGIRSALVSAGGSTIYGLGHPPGRDGWKVAVANPADANRPVAFIQLRDNALSTSGVSEQSLKAGERRYSHIFDPRSGAPVEGMCQATVIARSAAESDALTKPAYILPREEVTRVMKRYRGAHALRMEGACQGPPAVWMTPWSRPFFIGNTE